MTVSDSNLIQLVLKNTIERVQLHLVDSTGASVDAASLTLRVFDQFENQIIQDDITQGYGQPPVIPSKISHDGLGLYSFAFGDVGSDPLNSTATPLEYIFVWDVRLPSGLTEKVLQVVKVVSVRTMRLIPKLKTIVDKAAKAVDENPDDPVFVGYTDAMLVQFLEGGLGWINAFQPYPMWSTIEQFPEEQLRVLIDGAVCDALASQELFAVDTDVNYSDQGNVFVIDHQPKLSSILNATWIRFSSMVPNMKKHYLNNGAVRVEMGPSFRFQALLAAAPNGSLFRNAFLGGNSAIG